MRKYILGAIAALCLITSVMPCLGQDPDSTAGPGAPSAQSPVPDCIHFKKYRDTLTGNLWLSQGLPCTWVQPGSTAKLLDQGGAVFNVKAYGAKGDGSTDDSAAISSAISALTAAGGGILQFPQGNYVSPTCNWSITVPTIIQGTGKADPTNAQWGTKISCGNSTGYGFNVSALSGKMRDLSLINTATTPTAGSGVHVANATSNQRFDIEDAEINAFYRGVEQTSGSGWRIAGSTIHGAVDYQIYVTNTVSCDTGDWSISDSIIAGDRSANVSPAGIEIDCSGGGRIFHNKFLGGLTLMTNGVRMNVTGSSGQLHITDNNFDALTGASVNIVHGWSSIDIIGNHMYAGSGFPCVSADGISQSLVDANECHGGTAVAHAFVFTSSTGGLFNLTFGFNQDDIATGTQASISCSNTSCRDLSQLPIMSSMLKFVASGSTTVDAGITRDAANDFAFGNGTANDFSGAIKATNYQMVGGVLKMWSGSAYDSGVSRGGTATVCAGNGTAGDCSGALKSATTLTNANCSSSASPAVCSSASAGSVTVAASATTEVVNTTAVTANSQISLTFDSSLGTKLSVTCNTTNVAAWVSARTAGSNFTITVVSAPTTNPACFSYSIIN